MFSLAEQLRSAIALHQCGQLSQAQAIYETVLRINPGHADALHLLGVVAYQQRQFDKAVELIDRAIRSSSGNPAFYANRGLALQELKKLEAAHADYSKAISIKPDYAAAYNNRGHSLREMKKPDAAVADFDKAISINPDFAEAYYNRGLALQELKKLEAAHADYSKAISIKPDFAPAYNNRGRALRDMKKPDAAVADFDKAISLKPDFAEAYHNRGLALHELKKLEAALADYSKAISIKSDYVEAYNDRGNALQQLKKPEAAIVDYDLAISIKPDYAAAYNNRGNALRELKKPEAAIADFDKAISIMPDFAEAYYSRGLALHELRKLDAALANYGKAISIKSDYVEAYNNRGTALKDLKRLEAAIGDFNTAISIAPDLAAAYWNKALTLLLKGDLQTGFELFEWRWTAQFLPRRFAQPLWLGEQQLHNKRILLHSEQGLGDTIQFCRYASLLARAGVQVFLQVPGSLVRLLQSLEGVSQVLADGEPLPEFDYHTPLMSLPLAFKTDLSTIPSLTPYLHANPVKARDYRERIGERQKLKVGVVWNGGFRPNQPEIWAVNERRNIPLNMFARSMREIDVDFFSLQKGDPAESEIRHREIEYWPRANFYNFSNDIKDFSDTAALIANLDLVVSVDTSTAHLAAALGKPTWILNRFDTCWRWLLDRDDTPWYPSVKLYRQDDRENWEPVLHRAAGDLTKLANMHRSAC